MPNDAPQGPQVNVVGVLAPHAAEGPRLVLEARHTVDGRYNPKAHLTFVRRVAGTLPQPSNGE